MMILTRWSCATAWKPNSQIHLCCLRKLVLKSVKFWAIVPPSVSSVAKGSTAQDSVHDKSVLRSHDTALEWRLFDNASNLSRISHGKDCHFEFVIATRYARARRPQSPLPPQGQGPVTPDLILGSSSTLGSFLICSTVCLFFSGEEPEEVSSTRASLFWSTCMSVSTRMSSMTVLGICAGRDLNGIRRILHASTPPTSSCKTSGFALEIFCA